MKKKVALLMVLLIALTGVGLTGCGGGGAEVKSEQSTYATTLGQELKDLEDSYKKGIITQKQYEEAKERLIEQRTKKK
ncbi:MAG: hypothetical protein ACM3MB_11195 [Acidobacteriota bacterium]